MSVFFTLLSLAVAAACFAIRDLISHGKFSYGPSEGFWGEQSWRRKYYSNNGLMDLPLSNWYYDLFKIPYLEKFPLSATLLVFLTDGYHLMTLFMQLAIFAAISAVDWKMFLVCWLTWSLFFNVFYNVFNQAQGISVSRSEAESVIHNTSGPQTRFAPVGVPNGDGEIIIRTDGRQIIPSEDCKRQNICGYEPDGKKIWSRNKPGCKSGEIEGGPTY